jgi:hypothetical protein
MFELIEHWGLPAAIPLGTYAKYVHIGGSFMVRVRISTMAPHSKSVPYGRLACGVDSTVPACRKACTRFEVEEYVLSSESSCCGKPGN